jgi:dienelactone hydrolase
MFKNIFLLKTLAVLLCLGLSGCVTGEKFLTQRELAQPFSSLKWAQPTINAVYRAPEGKGPFPAVVILESCGGHSSTLDVWAGLFNKWGYASLVVRSLESRGYQYCRAPYDFYKMNDNVASDAYAALAHLATKPEINSEKVAVIGFSMGAFAINYNILSNNGRPALDFAAAISFYGKCPWSMYGIKSVPYLNIVGKLDDFYPACALAATNIYHKEKSFTLLALDDAHHAFDDPRVSGKKDISGHLMRYNKDATEKSVEAVKTFLLTHIGQD